MQVHNTRWQLPTAFVTLARTILPTAIHRWGGVTETRVIEKDSMGKLTVRGNIFVTCVRSVEECDVVGCLTNIFLQLFTTLCCVAWSYCVGARCFLVCTVYYATVL